MRKLSKLFIVLLSLLYCLSACATPPKTETEIPPVATSSFEPQPEKWSVVTIGDMSESNYISMPEYYNNLTYEQALEIAQQNIKHQHYELLWGEPNIISPDGIYTVYLSNKDDLVNGFLDIMLLNIVTQEETVLFRTQFVSTPTYPLWWIDAKRFVYEQDGLYYICDITSPKDIEMLEVYGNQPVIVAYDEVTFVYVEDSEKFEEQPRIISSVDGAQNPLKVFSYKNFLLYETAINNSLRFLILKSRLSLESADRNLIIYDYGNDVIFELLPPVIPDAETIYPVDFFWRENSLIVHFQVDYEDETWMYPFT